MGKPHKAQTEKSKQRSNASQSPEQQLKLKRGEQAPTPEPDLNLRLGVRVYIGTATLEDMGSYGLVVLPPNSCPIIGFGCQRHIQPGLPAELAAKAALSCVPTDSRASVHFVLREEPNEGNASLSVESVRTYLESRGAIGMTLSIDHIPYLSSDYSPAEYALFLAENAFSLLLDERRGYEAE